jgi:hypothetical protein
LELIGLRIAVLAGVGVSVDVGNAVNMAINVWYSKDVVIISAVKPAACMGSGLVCNTCIEPLKKNTASKTKPRFCYILSIFQQSAI